MSMREFTVEEARALIPEVRAQAAEIVRLRADLVLDLRTKGSSEVGGRPEAKAYEARLDEKATCSAQRRRSRWRSISPALG